MHVTGQDEQSRLCGDEQVPLPRVRPGQQERTFPTLRLTDRSQAGSRSVAPRVMACKENTLFHFANSEIFPSFSRYFDYANFQQVLAKTQIFAKM
jgi:hypothetical protein